jgi:simple sugar transport system permease protein
VLDGIQQHFLSDRFLQEGLYVTMFVENMSAGRGWISLAAVILVNGNPWGIALISLVFGFTDGLGLFLQKFMPDQFTAMVPYLATLVSLYIYSIKRRKKAQ